MECLHVTPSLVEVMKEVRERTCGGLLMLDVPGRNVTKARNRPIQWTARKKEETRQVVQMLNGPSQVMMKGTTLSVVHGERNEHKKGMG